MTRRYPGHILDSYRVQAGNPKRTMSVRRSRVIMVTVFVGAGVRCTEELDVTATAVQRLDQNLPRLKIEVVNPSAGAVGQTH
jgi:hypothetical protein